MEQESDSIQEQNVTRGLQLSEKAQGLTLLHGLVVIASMIFTVLPLIDARKHNHFEIIGAIFIAVLLLAIVSSIPAIFAWKAVILFKRENKKAYKDGQRWIGQQSFKNRFVFNKNASAAKRIYGK